MEQLYNCQLVQTYRPQTKAEGPSLVLVAQKQGEGKELPVNKPSGKNYQ